VSDVPPIELEGLDDAPQREWYGGDTFPAGELLREQIGYHLRKSWELANGLAKDADGQPIMDAARIAMSTTWHHEQAAVMATVYAAELNARHEVVINNEAPTLTLLPLQVGVGDEVVGEVHTSG
jgi:hypothetical protein